MKILIPLLLCFALPSAAQTLIGKQIKMDFTYPTADSVTITATATAIDPGVEVNCATPTSSGPLCGANINGGGYSVDIQPTRISFRTNSTISATFGAAVCNCLRFSLVNPGSTFFASVVLANNNIQGLTGLSVTDTSITVNWGGLRAPSQTVLDIDVTLGVKGGPLTVSPASLMLDSFAGGPPSSAYVTVGKDQPGRILTVNIITSSPWLTVTKPTRTPTSIKVTADPAALAEGSYIGQVEIQDAGGTPQSVLVTFTVEKNKPPKLDVTPTTFNINQRGPTGALSVRLRNLGSGTIGPLHFEWHTSNGALDSPVAPITPSSLTVSSSSPAYALIKTSLTGPVKRGLVYILDSNNAILARVPYMIQPNPFQLVSDQAALFFAALGDSGGASNPPHVPLDKVLRLTLHGGGIVQYTITADKPWISLSSGVGDITSQQSIVVGASTAFLQPGAYIARLTISYRRAGGQSKGFVIPVVMDVAPPTSAVRRDIVYRDVGPIIVTPVQPGVVDFAGVGAVPAPFQVTADYHGLPKFFNFSTDNLSGSSSSTPHTTLTPIAGLAAGTYAGEIAALDPVTNFVRRVLVLVVVPIQDVVRPAGSCQPAKLATVLVQPLWNFQVKAGNPVFLEAGSADDCGDFDSTTSVVVQFSNSDPPVPLTHIGNGRWRGIWVPVQEGSNVTVTATALTDFGTGTQVTAASMDVAGEVVANPDSPPIILDGGVVNSASYSNVLSPGSFISVFGLRMANDTQQAQSVPLGDTLAGASLLVGDKKIPLYYSSSGLISGVLPYDISTDANVPVLVEVGGKISMPRSMPVEPVAPGVFAYGNQRGVVVAYHSNGTADLTDALHPAQVGETVVIYCTGLGAVDPPVTAGSLTPLRLVPTTSPITVTIGGISAQIGYAGLAPGSTALYQINATVPAGIAPGDNVPLFVSGGTGTSEPVHISVR